MNTRTQSLKGAASPVAQTAAHTRWIQLGLGLVCMMTISSPQYVWTLMTKPLMAKYGIALPELQVTFSLLVLLHHCGWPRVFGEAAWIGVDLFFVLSGYTAQGSGGPRPVRACVERAS